MQGAVFWVPLIMPENTDNRKNKASTGIHCPWKLFLCPFWTLAARRGRFLWHNLCKTDTYVYKNFLYAGRIHL